MNFSFSNASKELKNEPQIESHKNGFEKNITENLERSSKKKKGGSWIDFFLPKPPAKVNIGVGDGLVNENGTVKPFWKRIFKRKKNKNKGIEATGPPNSESSDRDKFNSRFIFQREANVIKKEIIASSISSIISTIISHPLNVLKSNFQSVRYPKGPKHCCNRRRSFFYVVKDIMMTKGLPRFYKGHMKTQSESLYQTISMFWTYNQANKYLNNNEHLKDYPKVITFVSGFLSATIPTMFLYPLNNLSYRRSQKKTFIQNCGPICGKNIACEMNVRSIYHGCFSLFLHMGTLYGLRFLFFNKIRDDMTFTLATHDKATSTNATVSEVDTIVRLSNYQLIMAGGIAAVIGDLLAHPLDVVHERIRMSALKRQQFHFEQTCRRIGQCFMTILKNERILAFYSGLLPCLLKSTVNTAVQFAIYEETKIWLRLLLPT